MINLSIRFQNFVGIGAGGNQTRTVGNGCARTSSVSGSSVPYGSCTGIFTGLSAGLTGGSSFFSYDFKILQHVVFHEIHLLCQQYAQEWWIHTVTDKETENKNTRFRKKLRIWYFYVCGLV